MQNLLLLLSACVSSKHVETFLEEDANGRVALNDSAAEDAFKNAIHELGLRTLNNLDRVSVPRRLGSPGSSASSDNVPGRSDIGAPQSPPGSQQRAPPAAPTATPRVFRPEEKTQQPDTQQRNPPAAPTAIPHVLPSEEKTQQPDTQQPENHDCCGACFEEKDLTAHFDCGDGSETAIKHGLCDDCSSKWILGNPTGTELRTCPTCRQSLSKKSPLYEQATQLRVNPNLERRDVRRDRDEWRWALFVEDDGREIRRWIRWVEDDDVGDDIFREAILEQRQGFIRSGVRRIRSGIRSGIRNIRSGIRSGDLGA